VKPALFTAAAEADVEEALQWYETQRPGLGAAFRRALDVAVAAVESRPDSYAVLHRNIRRVLLPKFPYGLYYCVMDECILVLGCIHAKRHPRVWRTR
jgi:plasmid stabilization system protein ParE